MTLNALELFKVPHHPTKFNGHRHCGSGDIVVLVSHVISRDHVINSHLTSWVGTHQGKLTSFKIRWSLW